MQKTIQLKRWQLAALELSRYAFEYDGSAIRIDEKTIEQIHYDLDLRLRDCLFTSANQHWVNNDEVFGAFWLNHQGEFLRDFERMKYGDFIKFADLSGEQVGSNKLEHTIRPEDIDTVVSLGAYAVYNICVPIFSDREYEREMEEMLFRETITIDYEDLFEKNEYVELDPEEVDEDEIVEKIRTYFGDYFPMFSRIVFNDNIDMVCENCYDEEDNVTRSEISKVEVFEINWSVDKYDSVTIAKAIVAWMLRETLENIVS